MNTSSLVLDGKPYTLSAEPKDHCKEDEILQDFLYGKFKILQKKDGYRFSVDPVLLASFVEMTGKEQIIDLGTGSGIMPLILSEQIRSGSIVGLEYQQQYVDMANRSVRINDLEDLISIQQGDVRNVRKKLKPESFDLAISNPPFLASGTGHVNPKNDKAIARHEVVATLEDFICAARYLTRQNARSYFVFPAGRIVDLLSILREKKLEPRRMQLVHANERSQAKLALVESVKGGKPGLKVHRPLFIYNLNGQYTDEVAHILHDPKYRQ